MIYIFIFNYYEHFLFIWKTGFISSCLIQPLVINENTEDAETQVLHAGDERSMKFKRIVYSSPKVRANLRKLIPLFDEMGIFDWIIDNRQH